MGKNTAIIIGGVVVVLAIAGGLVFYSMQNTAPLAGPADTTTKATSTTNTTSTTNPTQTTTTVTTTTIRQPAQPVTITSSTVAPTDTTAVLGGTVTPNGAFASYWFEYGPTSSLGNKTVNQTVGSGYAAISAPAYITGLTKDTTYYFRLVGQNQYGTTTGAQYTFQTSHGNPPPVGSAPTSKTLAGSGVSRTTANLNGGVTPNKATTQYWFEYGTTTSLGNITAFVSVGDGSSNVPVSASLSDLNPLTTYYFRLDAQNQFGTVNGSILNFKTSGPAAPTIPSVTTRSASNVGNSTTILHGTVDPNGAETTYWFEYSTDSFLNLVLMQTTSQTSAGTGTNAASVQANVSSLNSNTTYYFRIVAQNSLGIVRGDAMTFKTK